MQAGASQTALSPAARTGLTRHHLRITQENHIPKTCDEVAKERSLASVHGVEEAMTAALIKNCPKCKVRHASRTAATR